MIIKAESSFMNIFNEYATRTYSTRHVDGKGKVVTKNSDGTVTKVIAILKSYDSARYTKMAKDLKRIESLEQEIKSLKENMKQETRENITELFDAEDSIYTREVETCQFIFKLTKDPKPTESYQYKKILDELQENFTPELKIMYESLLDKYRSVVQKPPALSVTDKNDIISEGIIDTIKKYFTKFKNKVLSWAEKYDSRLDALKKQAGMSLSESEEQSEKRFDQKYDVLVALQNTDDDIWLVIKTPETCFGLLRQEGEWLYTKDTLSRLMYRSKQYSLQKYENALDRIQEFDKVIDKVIKIKKINEGGNAFPTNKSLRRIKRQEIIPTLEWLETLLNIPNLTQDYMKTHLFGSTLKQDDSGDIDIVLNIIPDDKPFIKTNDVVFDTDILRTIASKIRTTLGNEYVNTKGIKTGQIHILLPIEGKDDNGFVQVDFLIGDPEWLRFSHYSPGKDNSDYKGVWISTALGVLAKYKILYTYPAGNRSERLARLGWAYDLEKGLRIRAQAQLRPNQGLSELDPDKWETYVGMKWPNSNPPHVPKIGYITNPIDVIQILLGDDVTAEDINTFEKLYEVIKKKINAKDLDISLSDFNDRFTKALARSGASRASNKITPDEFAQDKIFQ